LSRLGSRRQLTDEEAEAQRKLVQSTSASFKHGAKSAIEPQLAVMAARQGDEILVREFVRQHEALVDAALEDEYTLLHVAAESGQGRICALLLANGASAEVVDSDLQTPLHVAAACGNLEAARALSNKPCKELLQPDKYKMTPFHLACESGSRELVEYFVRTHKIHKDMRKGSGLFIAQRNNHASVVSLLEEASIRFKLSNATTPRSEGGVLDVIADRKSRASHDASAANDHSPRHSGHTTPNHTSNASPVHSPNFSPMPSPSSAPSHTCTFVPTLLTTLSSSLNALETSQPSPCEPSASQPSASTMPLSKTPISESPLSQCVPTLAFATPPGLRRDASPTARSRRSRADEYDSVTPEPLRNTAASSKSSVRSKDRVSFVDAGAGAGGSGRIGSGHIGSGRIGSACGCSGCDPGVLQDGNMSAGTGVEELSASGLPLRKSQIVSRNRYIRKLAAGELDLQKPDTKANRKSSMCILL